MSDAWKPASRFLDGACEIKLGVLVKPASREKTLFLSAEQKHWMWATKVRSNCFDLSDLNLLEK